MTGDGNKPLPQRFSLKRWSQRKLEAAREQTSAPAGPVAPPVGSVPVVLSPATEPARSAPAVASEAPELPPTESLTFESDFSAFLQPKVEEAVKRQALKQLFRDPRFNVMDGLDVYIDDYSIPSPVSPELLREMLHARFTLDPPKTRINAEGYVEDVPPEEIPVAATDAMPAGVAHAPGELADDGGTPGSTEGAAQARSTPEGDADAQVDAPAIPDAYGSATLPQQRLHARPSDGAAPAAPPLAQRNDHR